MTSPSRDTEAEILDEEIAALKAQLSSLKRKIKVQSSTVMNSDAARTAIRSASSARNPSNAALLEHSEKHRAHIQQCLYRIASSITAFKVQDPDPNSVDGGHVLGLRFEIMSRGQFLKPYYVMLNRPYPDSTYLRVHRHTVPPAVPLAALAARHLAEPRAQEVESRPQDLERFARSLRREIIRYHNRLGVSADLRRVLGFQDEESPSASENKIVNLGLADIEAKQIELTWADERNGRLVMDDDGRVLKLAIYGKHGRDWELAGQLCERNDRIEQVAKKIQDYTAG